ncbi:MAG: hypothetical protein F9K19_15475 [Rhizobiaceae bacterium]|nr:MAG: hypothetical protein F9K19_15475 [Rhizobiaceae bacterium]CAG0978278.1 hypothetical protein RHIZO_01593 [Rhizobiaceae bacterium]
MARLAALLLAAWAASAASAAAQVAESSETEPALYPEIILETDDSYSADASLAAFRDALIAAGEALVRTEQGE